MTRGWFHLNGTWRDMFECNTEKSLEMTLIEAEVFLFLKSMEITVTYADQVLEHFIGEGWNNPDNYDRDYSIFIKT